MPKPLCFVLMPFSKGRSDNEDRLLDFDSVYAHVIAPAVENAGLRAHRADEETLGGIFHQQMFERLALCEYAVADLSMANPNVFYELGIRHALRPYSTILMFRDDAPLPLDVAEAQALQYSIDVVNDPAQRDHLRSQLTARLLRARERVVDSPVHTLVKGLPVPEVDHRRVDLMLEAIDRESEVAQRIAQAQREGLAGLRRLRKSLPPIDRLASESAVNLMLAFRAHRGWEDMVSLVSEMTPALAEVMLVREQRALALARVGRFGEAEADLKALLERRRNSETYGLLGGVYKRQWEAAVRDGRPPAVTRTLLAKSIAAYKAGFDVDLRDPYPGLNALGLMKRAGDREGVASLAPVLRYSVERRLDNREREYWDHACAVELELIVGDVAAAERAFDALLLGVEDVFQAGTTGETLLAMATASSDPDFAGRIRRMAEELQAVADQINSSGEQN